MIPYGRQEISDEDIQAVIDVLKSDYLTQGTTVPAFEKAVCDYTGARYGVAVNSGTSALHIACLALGLSKGDWLWTTPITFVASANCGLYCGAKVDFVDIDPVTWNISIDDLKNRLVKAKEEKRLPKVLVAVHLCGQSCGMESIQKLSAEYGFFVIEDASHAIGGRYQGLPVGNCQNSSITVFSFHPVKTMTTGEGGMAVTNDEDLAEKMMLLRSHGITRDQSKMTHSPDGPWYYQQIMLGFNYRMTDFQAALGISQLQRLDKFILRRHEIAKKYAELMKTFALQLPLDIPESYSALHLFVVRVGKAGSSKSHRQIFDAMRDQGIGINIHYIPVHTQPYYQKKGFAEGDFPEAESYYREAISLPMFPGLSDKEQDHVVSVLKSEIK